MPWFDTECLNTKNKICHLGNKLKEATGDKEIRTKLRKKKRQHKQKIINEMENNKNKDPKIFWKLTKKLEQMNTCNTVLFRASVCTVNKLCFPHLLSYRQTSLSPFTTKLTTLQNLNFIFIYILTSISLDLNLVVTLSWMTCHV